MFHPQFNPLAIAPQPHENRNAVFDFNTTTLTLPQTLPTAADPTIYVGLCQTMASTTTTHFGPLSPLDKLAVELITLISFYACTDGGPTGCALSLVSKRIRAASRPARFFSVSLTTESSTQLKQFLACYQAECTRAPDALPRVQHLCLSLFGTEQDGAVAPPNTGNPHSSFPSGPTQPQPTSRAEFLARMRRQAQQWRSAQDRLDEGFNHIVPALFRAVASDLRTLTLVQARWRVNGAAQCCFAHLRELTLVGGDANFLPFCFTQPQDGRPQFPSLRRLHHNLAFVGTGLNFLEWAAHAPNLTHLRVSRLDSHPRVIVDTLDQAIGDQAAEYFPHLQHVTIQPIAAHAPSHSNVGGLVEFREFMAYLERLKERAKAPVDILPPVEQSIIHPGVDRHQGCLMRLKRQWMERIEGEGPGCWGDDVECQPASHH